MSMVPAIAPPGPITIGAGGPASIASVTPVTVPASGAPETASVTVARSVTGVAPLATAGDTPGAVKTGAVRSRGAGRALSNAATASTRPAPVPGATSASAVAITAAVCSAGSMPGCRARRSASTPVTCGAAIDVPLTVCQPPVRSAVRTSVPGAVRSGKARPSQGDVPRPDSGRAAVPLASRAPTARASGSVAGLDGTVAFPAAKTTRMPAARSAARSGSNAVWQPAVASPQLALTMAGASAVSGSPSGSSAHWKAAWTALAEARQVSSKMRAAIRVASGATP